MRGTLSLQIQHCGHSLCSYGSQVSKEKNPQQLSWRNKHVVMVSPLSISFPYSHHHNVAPKSIENVVGQSRLTVQSSATFSSEVVSPIESGQKLILHELPSGNRIEVIQLLASKEGKKLSPIVFIHGSYHSAWCWAEYWMPWFATLGHDCFSISLLGQGLSDVPDAPVAGTIQSHASDVAHFISHHLTSAPVLIGHSFGGLITQAYLADVSQTWDENFPLVSESDGWNPPYPRLAAAVLACSVPPTGNMKLVKRFMETRPIATIKITLSLAAKLFEKWTWLCKETFFSPAMPDKEVKRFQELLKGSCKVPLFNLKELNASLPVASPPLHAPPVLVLGAENDFVVDNEGLVETAAFFGVDAVVIPNIAHDIMLDLEWESAARTVSKWILELDE